MKWFVGRFAICSLALLGVPATARAVDASAAQAAAARHILRSHCYQCHNGVGSAGGDVDVLDRQQLVDAAYIEPGSPATSYLLERIVNESMPPLEQRLRNPVDAEELAVITSWIQAGAPSFRDEIEQRDAITAARVMRSVRDHLLQTPPEERPFLRFFTFHPLHNNPRNKEADLRLYRAALSKAINSLHWAADIRLPAAVAIGSEGDEGTAAAATPSGAAVVYAIDMRRLIDADGKTWDETNRWTTLVRAYPYGVSYAGSPQTAEAKLQEEIRRLMQPRTEANPLDRVAVPILRADWFVANALRPPLYHQLLGLPKSLFEFEQQLEVDVKAGFLASNETPLARAGFAKSGVSGQNRLVERTTSRFGAYWRSYDFLPTTKHANVRRFPLGPLNLFADGEHPFADQAFRHDGGEIIFELPNGLHGYMLVDGDHQRVDAGPIELVNDALKTAGTPAIVTGISCMACHAQGVIDFQDEIRNANSVYGEPAKAVARLFPPSSDMAKLVERDRKNYLRALQKAAGPFLLKGLDADKSINEFADPAGEAARAYRLVYLDAETIAYELDVAAPDEVIRRIGERRLKELGLEHVFVGGGVISRDEWEASDGRSLMQDAAFELGLTPIQ